MYKWQENTLLFLIFQYNPEFVLAIDSFWEVVADNNYKNLTGTMQAKTPFNGMRNGALVSKIMLKNNKYLRGVADLDVNHKKVSINMEGKLNKITDCMLIINATSLDDKYQLKFLISTELRNFVAMLTYPGGHLGTEVHLSLTSIVNFDVKLQLATPIEFLQNVLVVAKLKPEQVTFLEETQDKIYRYIFSGRFSAIMEHTRFRIFWRVAL